MHTRSEPNSGKALVVAEPAVQRTLAVVEPMVAGLVSRIQHYARILTLVVVGTRQKPIAGTRGEVENDEHLFVGDSFLPY